MGDADKPSGMLQSHKSPLKSMQTYSSGMFGACDLTAMGLSLRAEVEGGSWLKSHVGRRPGSTTIKLSALHPRGRFLSPSSLCSSAWKSLTASPQLPEDEISKSHICAPQLTPPHSTAITEYKQASQSSASAASFSFYLQQTVSADATMGQTFSCTLTQISNRPIKCH